MYLSKFLRKCASGFLALTVASTMLLTNASGAGSEIPYDSSITYGDVNGDDTVDSADYTILRSYLISKISEFPNPNGKLAADVNLDGSIDSADFTFLRKFLLKIIDSLPVGEKPTQPPLIPVSSMLDNADFEVGSTTGWSPMGSVTLEATDVQAYAGKYSLKVSDRTDTWNGAAQSVLNKFENGGVYNISVRVKLDNAESDTVKVTLATSIGGNATYSNLATGTASNTEWTEITGTYTHNVSEQPESLNLYVEGPAAGVNYYVDNVSVTSTGVFLTSTPTVTPTPTIVQQPKGTLKVMPLGDSITDGIFTPGSYRTKLWKSITGDGFKVDFVGSLSGGPSDLGDKDHEGHSGWRIDEIDAKINNCMSTYNPDIVLLHIGTNDITQKYDVSNAPNRVGGLIDKICAKLPSGGKIFVASIIPINNRDVSSYNNQLSSVVQSKISQGKPVQLVNMNSALTVSDLSDGVHPNQNGYNKMADVWYKAIKSEFVGGGSVVVPTGKVTPTVKASTPTPTPNKSTGSKFHCFLLLGQSNMAGYSKAEAADKVEDPRVMVLGYDNNSSLGRVTDQWDTACPPLHEAWNGALGPGDWFGKTMIQKVPSGDTIGLIPCAISGEKIETFMKSGSKYNWILNRAKLAQQKGGVIEGIIFHQGESNSGQSDWPSKVSSMVSDLRKDLNLGDVPFIAAELLYSGPCASHNTQVNKLPSLIKNCSVVSASGLVVNSGDTAYRLHFDHDSTVTLGKRYAEKMIQALGW